MFYVELLNPCYSYSSIEDSQSEEPVENFPQQNQGLFSDINNNRQTQKGLEGYLQTFLNIWNRELEPDGEFSWQVIQFQFKETKSFMLAIVFSTQEYGEKPQPVSELEQKQRIESFNQLIKQKNDLVCSVSDTKIIIIKRNEQKLWTCSMARKDAGEAMLQLLNLQESQKNQENQYA
jgi:ribosomal protein L37AE/L43A